MTKEQSEALGYSNVREIGEVGFCGLMKMAFTTGLFVDIGEWSCSGRYCYEYWHEAEEALNKWDGKGDPSGNWIKRKFSGERDRHGPGSTVPMEFR